MTSNTTVEDARRIPNTCYTVGGGNGQGRVYQYGWVGQNTKHEGILSNYLVPSRQAQDLLSGGTQQHPVDIPSSVDIQYSVDIQ